MVFYSIIIGLCILISLALIGVIMLQNSKGGGLSAGAAGSQITKMFGARQGADGAEKTTWALLGTLILLTLAANFMLPSDQNGAGGELGKLKNVTTQIDDSPESVPTLAPDPQAAQPATGDGAEGEGTTND